MAASGLHLCDCFKLLLLIKIIGMFMFSAFSLCCVSFCLLNNVKLYMFI